METEKPLNPELTWTSLGQLLYSTGGWSPKLYGFMNPTLLLHPPPCVWWRLSQESRMAMSSSSWPYWGLRKKPWPPTSFLLLCDPSLFQNFIVYVLEKNELPPGADHNENIATQKLSSCPVFNKTTYFWLSGFNKKSRKKEWKGTLRFMQCQQIAKSGLFLRSCVNSDKVGCLGLHQFWFEFCFLLLKYYSLGIYLHLLKLLLTPAVAKIQQAFTVAQSLKGIVWSAQGLFMEIRQVAY